MDGGVEVRRSSRARRWRLEARFGEPVRLTVPLWASDAEVAQVLAEKRRWIEAQRRRQAPRLGLERVGATEAQLRARARALVTAIVEAEAAQMGLVYGRIRIAGQRTRWGSCSSSGTLSFNWRLALAPPAVLDYVVVHELCHLRFPDHSRRFWALVERERPHWRAQREWLREYGSELLAYRPPGAAAAA